MNERGFPQEREVRETAINFAPATETPIPTGLELTPFDEAFRNDPYPVLERLRDAAPIHRDEALSRWFVTGFETGIQLPAGAEFPRIAAAVGE